MLLNLTENPEVNKKKVIEAVGDSFDEETRQKMGGVISGKFIIQFGSIDIFNLLVSNHGINTCTIELRPDGIIIRFNSGLENYALVIPYYKLKMYKGKEYSLYKDNHFIKIEADRQAVHDFMKKIRKHKGEHWTSAPDPWEL